MHSLSPLFRDTEITATVNLICSETRTQFKRKNGSLSAVSSNQQTPAAPSKSKDSLTAKQHDAPKTI